jgi:uncharacterized membrane protein YdjX (TVP38/TMEM64 family)
LVISKKYNSIIYAVYSGVMPLIMSGLMSILVYRNIGFLQNLDITNKIFFWLLASLAMGLSVIPTSFIALVSGFIWGLKAIIPLIVSYIFATILGYLLSSFIDKNFILTEINKNNKAKKILANLKNEQFKIIVFARLSPVFPFGISNVIFTYLGVPLKQLILVGILGMLPRTIFMVWISSQADSLKKLFTKNWSNYFDSPLFIIGLVSIFGLVFLVYRAIKKA